MSTKTPATQMLTKAGVTFTTREYDFVGGQSNIALHAAEAIGADPDTVLKTLMVEVDGKPACCVIQSDHSLSMKKVAHAFGGKSAQMMDTAKAERLTGYHKGGISPFGQRSRAPVAFEETTMVHETVVINGGKRGMMVVLAPQDAVQATAGMVAPLIAES
ncbi:Cys-tRNA(Pro) deacylase [Paenirhodobacter populi]|uniref:Cys-tRNA(Pro) deacylase n=1 Tax=Paenirhodobacter populi TaxID=2306993 RepID=UPI000FE42A5D|nr:Cys-tRNA(Pro) deacylase [Sinirhodobacter populi]RWR04760.1 Cys-tRNA(Pro) deacylase [Sinirhodobacter populi]